MDMKPNLSKGKSVGSRLLEKMLMPIVATAASAAATYAAKKGPQLLDEKIVPRMRELMNGGGSSSEGPAAEAESTADDGGRRRRRELDRPRPLRRRRHGGFGAQCRQFEWTFEWTSREANLQRGARAQATRAGRGTQTAPGLREVRNETWQ
jgi:hypothetical protein